MSRPLSLRLYRALTRVATPLAPAWLSIRARRGKEDADRWRERLGEASRTRPRGRLAWLHGVSVGESLSLLPLIEQLARQYPDVAVLVTSGTRASGDLLAQRLPRRVIHQYAPLDTPGAVAKFLRYWRPGLCVVAESELWPNLICDASARGVKLALVSARLSDRSVRSWSRAPGAARVLLSAFALILARDAEAARRLTGLGARVDGLADLKLGAAPLGADADELGRLRDHLKDRPVILAASTHPGEEAAVLERFRAACGDRRDPLLILAPRHVERGPSILPLAQDMGLRAAARSDQPDPARLDVYVADTMGEVGLWYRLARVAFLGGSLAPGPGGHNPLEPARLGCPVVSGDKVENWPIYRDLDRAGGVVLVDRPEGLDAVFAAALDDPRALAAMAEKAGAYVADRDAEASRSIARVLALLDP
jgi:3-deoxy-D-manno-octulosonic-acid transferase